MRGEAGAERQVPQSRRSRRHLARVLSPCDRLAPPPPFSRERPRRAGSGERRAALSRHFRHRGRAGTPRDRARRAPERPARGSGRARAASRGRARRDGPEPPGGLEGGGNARPGRARPPRPVTDRRGGARQDTPPCRPRPRRRLRSGIGHSPRRCCRRAPPQRRELRP